MAISIKEITLRGQDFLEIIDLETEALDGILVSKEEALELLAQLTEKLK